MRPLHPIESNWLHASHTLTIGEAVDCCGVSLPVPLFGSRSFNERPLCQKLPFRVSKIQLPLYPRKLTQSSTNSDIVLATFIEPAPYRPVICPARQGKDLWLRRFRCFLVGELLKNQRQLSFPTHWPRQPSRVSRSLTNGFRGEDIHFLRPFRVLNLNKAYPSILSTVKVIHSPQHGQFQSGTTNY
jgi:hypothetical protein